MKKAFSFIIALVLLCSLFLFGCGHSHSFTLKIISDDFLCSSANCEGGAKYYYSCACGKKGEEVFEHGDPKHEGEGAICSSCNKKAYSEGLYFQKSFDQTHYSLAGLGDCADKDIIIPSVYNGLPVTEISTSALSSSEVDSVFIPWSVTKIGAYAFCDSTVKSVRIGGEVLSIDDYAFSGCNALSSVAIPDSVTRLGKYCFYECTSLSSAVLSNKITSIEEFTFYNTAIESVVIPSSVATIGVNAFQNCKSLARVEFNEGLISIGEYAFEQCSSLTSVSLPSSISQIDRRIFMYCSSLSSVTLPAKKMVINAEIFYGTAYYNNQENWKDSVLYIGKHLIAVRKTLPADYKIKEGTVTIANAGFWNCTTLTSIYIPKSVIYVGDHAFYLCSSITDTYYGGSQADWQKVGFGYYNDTMVKATMHYNSSGKQ